MPNQPPRYNQNQIRKRYQPSESVKFDIPALIDKNGNVLPNLIGEEGNNNAKDLAYKLSKSDGVSINQIRKFYDNFLKIYFSRLSIDAKKVQLIMMKAQLEYAQSRLKMQNFTNLINNGLSLVIKSDDNNFQDNIHAMKLHFESIVGYFPKSN